MNVLVRRGGEEHFLTLHKCTYRYFAKDSGLNSPRFCVKSVHWFPFAMATVAILRGKMYYGNDSLPLKMAAIANTCFLFISPSLPPVVAE